MTDPESTASASGNPVTRHLTGYDSEWHHAHIFPNEADFRYPEGFKMAAEVLVDHIYSSGHFSYWADSLLYPIAYLLRHYLELKLKSVLVDLGIQVKQDHRLKNLWRELTSGAGSLLPADRSGEHQEKIDQLADRI